MKYIQIIDEAVDCSYPIYRCSDADFKLVFPAPGQDVEFTGDIAQRLGPHEAKILMDRLTSEPADKKSIDAHHGFLFVGLEYKKQFYPTKKDSEMSNGIIYNDDEGDEEE